ncbi:MAG: response regulator [Candidatus Aminicenantes bacterium]|nr:response regulator [Candidatus Aminicenantes bacterium]TET24118.1 MAG: response regulator [Candidatus Aminicenantes bacterium]TET71320.1 MAG: response regulator [Candidatus Aminicenantes bacterium]
MSKKIVVIDDDRITLTMLEMVFSRHGFQVFSAQDGAEGYELAQKEKPDILISDMLLPKIHGTELCKKIKETPELKQTKVILMTAVYKGPSFRFEARDCGADDFIEKPLDMKDLLSRIDKFLKKE